jgi:hypothetical protein
VPEVNGGGGVVDWQMASRYPKKVLKNRAGKVVSMPCKGVVKRSEGQLHLQPNPTVHQ